MESCEPLLEITATDPTVVAAQQEVLDTFKAADEAMSEIDLACEQLHAVLDSLGASRMGREQYIKRCDEFFAPQD